MCGDVVRASSSWYVQMRMDVDRILGICMSRCDQTLQDMHGHVEMSDIHAAKIHWKGLDMRYPGNQDSRHYIYRAGYRGYTPNVEPLLNLDTPNVPGVTLDTVCCSLDKPVHPVGV